MKFKIYNLPADFALKVEDIKKMVTYAAKMMDLGAESCSVILVNDEQLRAMHEEYLSDPEYTDVMTFNLGDEKIEGEIYVSIDRISDHARHYHVSILHELLRTIVHGLLHLKGLTDESDDNRAAMHSEENKYLDMLNSVFKIDL